MSNENQVAETPKTEMEMLKPPVPMGSPPDPYDRKQGRTLGSNEQSHVDKLSEAQNKAVDRIKSIAEKNQTNSVAHSQTQNKGRSA